MRIVGEEVRRVRAEKERKMHEGEGGKSRQSGCETRSCDGGGTEYVLTSVYQSVFCADIEGEEKQ